MRSEDAWNTGWEEVHLPDACQRPELAAPGVTEGCMDRGALNYDPAARQPGKCTYSNEGCMDSLALNYNSEATIDTPTTCIYGVCGCNMGTGSGSAYEHVHSTADKYQSLPVGLPLPGMASETDVGMVTFASYAAVTTTNALATATVMGGPTCSTAHHGGNVCTGPHCCTFVIEGCMSPTAINYNPHANKNSNTWCVEPKPGCMMPSVSMSSGYIGSGNGVGITELDRAADPRLNRFGYAAPSGVGFYDPSATVHDKSVCTLDYVGCTDPTAANYMPWARVNSGCIPNIVGCLHPAALNKNCGGPTSYLSFTECTGSGLATVHANDFCNFYQITVAENNKAAESAKIAITVDGDCATVQADTATRTKLVAFLASSVGIDASSIQVAVTCGSATIEATFPALDATQYANFQLMEATALSTTEGAQMLLQAAGISGYTVLSVTITRVENIAYPPPSAPPDEAAFVGMIIGIVIAGLVVLGLVVVGILCAPPGLARCPRRAARSRAARCPSPAPRSPLLTPPTPRAPSQLPEEEGEEPRGRPSLMSTAMCVFTRSLEQGLSWDWGRGMGQVVAAAAAAGGDAPHTRTDCGRLSLLRVVFVMAHVLSLEAPLPGASA